MKVGEYVRYKYENCIYIGKIKFISEVMGFEETLQLDIDTCMEEILKENIIKSSPNIIDLIEVGDYVNGSEVHTIFEPCEYKNEKEILCIGIGGFEGELCFSNKDIKSIVTKEQFSRMEYRIGE